MPPPLRNPAPDLLFQDQQAARVAEIAPLLDAPEGVSAATPLHRLTVFVTYRCNLACPYCKTIARDAADLRANPRKGASFDATGFARLLEAHAGTPIRHLHLTGGEASLARELGAMIRAAKAAGIQHVSLTSNGTLPAERYRRLGEDGLDELRVSIDAADAALGDALAARAGAWRRTADTLRALGGLADRRFYLIANVVVGLRNRDRLGRLVAFLVDTGVDDVKLITEVDRRDVLGDFPEADRELAAVEARLAGVAAHAFPLLRRKLRTVFAADAVGLATEQPPAGDAWRCYVPLTERTVDGGAYYPCSVYLREGGAPLGPLTDDPETQRRKSAAFTATHDCLQDSICRRYCLHCTRGYNALANAARAVGGAPCTP